MNIDTTDEAIREIYAWWEIWNSVEAKKVLAKRLGISASKLNMVFEIFDEISAPKLRELRAAWEKRSAIKTKEEVMEQYELSATELANLMARFNRHQAGMQ